MQRSPAQTSDRLDILMFLTNISLICLQEFLSVSSVVIPAKTGLQEAARSYTQLPPDVTNDLKERFKTLHTAFTVLNQVVNKFNDNEKKQGFGKLGKGFRMSRSLP